MVQSYDTLHAKYNDYFVIFSVQTDTKALALKQYKDRCQENKNFKAENAKAKKQENVCENVEVKKMQQLISNQVAVCTEASGTSCIQHKTCTYKEKE